MQSRTSIHALFHPRNVALVGASDRLDHWSKRVWDNLERFRFPGHVFAVNPGRKALWRQKCFSRLAELPQAPDHLAIFTPAEATLQLLREGAAAGARTATLYAAGFGEAGNEAGLRLAGQLREVLAETGIIAVGPACMGVACGASRFATIPDETLQPLAPGPVALIAQSGAICGSINRSLNELGLKLAYMASCGSQIGCSISDFLDYFADQPELKTVLCYIEAVPDAERFLNAARKARENGKSVVAVKVGGLEEVRASALAHTGSLAGRTEVFDAYASAAGVVRLSSLEDAIEAVEFLARRPLPRGRKIAAMTISGALCSLILEGAAASGAELSSFSENTAGALGQILGQADIGNPLDTKRTLPREQFISCLDTMLKAPEVDIVLVAEELPLKEGVQRKVANLRALEEISRDAGTLGKSIAMFTPLLVGATEYGRGIRAEMPSIPILRNTQSALRVMQALGNAGTRPLHAGAFFATPADTETTRYWRKRAAGLHGPTALNEVESKALLQSYGITLPREEFVRSASEAEDAARRIGFPVVFKAVSASVTHKSDAGFVLLGVADQTSLRKGVEEMNRRAKLIDLTLDGFLVAQQVSGGTETILGTGYDVEMGPFVMFGLGGLGVELFKDVSLAPADLTRERAELMIRATRAGQLLDGYRGGKPGDIQALIDALVNMGRLARDLEDVIDAIDVNPVVVTESGIVALDGLVVLRPPRSLRSPVAPDA